MRSNSLILIGGGGHCKACIDVIETEGRFIIKGILDVKEKIGQKISGYPIIGTDNEIANLIEEGCCFLITLGQIKSAKTRKSFYNKLIELNAELVTVISSHARVSRNAKIGTGTIIMHHANISADVHVGENCIINTGSNLEHDTIIGNHCHVSTNAVINGNSKLGDEVFIGSGSIISNGITITDAVVIGIGTIIYRSIHQSGTFVGNPLRKI